MLRLNLGDLLTWQDEEYVVTAARAHTVMLRRLCDNEVVWIDVPSLADDFHLSHQGARAEEAERPPYSESIRSAELERAQWWVQHLNEVAHGVTDPDDPEAVPRPGYGAGTSRQERRALKVRELTAAGHQVSVRTLQRKQKDFEAHGVHGLIDRRQLRTSAAPHVDDRVLEAVLAVLAATRNDSTVTVATLIDKARAHLARRYSTESIALPSERTMRRVFAAYDRRGLATGKATTRRTDANRHARGPRPIAATTPGQYVEIDSTPINVMALLPDGRTGRVHLTVAMDVATRSIVAFDIVPVGASGVEHADLLGRMLRPRACRPDAPAYMRLDRAADLPAGAMLAADQRQAGAIAVPYIVPETITTDRGKDYLSETFMSACRHFGISVIAAPPHSPTYKGHIERLMGTIETSWMQKLPGYLGNSVANRGRDIDHANLLTVRELRDAFEEWWVRVYQRTPHGELRDRDLPSRCYTPNQMFAALFDAGAGIPVPIDETTFISLMRPYARVIQNDGIHIENLTYWHDDLVELRKMRAPTKDGKWTVRKDPYDADRAWIQHPTSGEWLECVSESYRRDAYPFASRLRLLRNAPPNAEDAAEAWAQERLKRPNKPAAGHRGSARKAAKSDAVRARRAAEDEPRPAPIGDPQPASTDGSADDFAIVRTSDRLWND